MTTVWGIHNDELGVELFEQGFVSIGFAGVGDMRQVGNDREKLDEAAPALLAVDVQGLEDGHDVLLDSELPENGRLLS